MLETCHFSADFEYGLNGACVARASSFVLHVVRALGLAFGIDFLHDPRDQMGQNDAGVY